MGNNGKVVQFKSRNEIIKEGDGSNIKPFEEYKEELYEKMEEYNLVAKNHIEARMIADLIMERDDNVYYCKFESCKSRVGEFIEVIPVYKSESVKPPLFIRNEIFSSYIIKLENEGLIVEGPGGMLLLKNKNED